MHGTHEITGLIIETFRLNGQLLAAGDELVAELGLTSARWQVLGAIALASVPLPVARIARNMGLTRQAVQRLANELEQEDFVRFEPNPHHSRAKLVVFTPRGRAVYDSASKRQRPWAAKLAAGMPADRIEAATETLREIRKRLTGLQNRDSNSKDPRVRRRGVRT